MPLRLRQQVGSAAAIRRAMNPHEPDGFVAVTDRRFTMLGSQAAPYDTLLTEGWDTTERNNLAKDGGATRLVDEDNPLGRKAVEFLYPAGFLSGYAPGLLQMGTALLPFATAVSSLYLQLVFRFSANWQGHTSPTNKICFVGLNEGGNHVFPRLRGIVPSDGGDPVNGPLRYSVGLQGTDDAREEVKENGDTGLIGNTANAPYTCTRGVWYRAEHHLTLNTPGVSDGACRVWLSAWDAGTGRWGASALTHDYANVRYRAAGQADRHFSYVKLDPVWGGGSDVAAADMSLRFCRVYYSRAA